jgi:hypothetical protein
VFDRRQGKLGVDVAETALMRGDDDIFGCPERMVRRQRLVLKNVERGACKLAASSAFINAASSTTPPRARLTR